MHQLITGPREAWCLCGVKFDRDGDWASEWFQHRDGVTQ